VTDVAPGRGPEFTAAEQAVLGSIIGNRARAEIVTGLLDRDDCFGDAEHQSVYAAVKHLTDAGGPVDAPSVLARLVATEPGVWRTGQAGVILGGLMEHASPSYAAHARKVLAGAQIRDQAAALTTSLQMVMAPGFDPAAGGDMIRQLVDQAVTGQAAEPLKSQAEILTEVLDDLQHGVTPGVPTGFADLDAAIGSLRPGTLTVIGARPAVGKTALALTIADHIASRCGMPVLFSSLEMSPAELMHRRIAATAKVSMDALTKHQLSERDWDRISAARDRLASAPLVVDGKEGASLAHIRARLRGLTRGEDPVRAAVVDQLGLMDAGQAENRQVAVAGLSRGLKNLAREFNIPLLLLVQINRGPETRTDKVPVMSDLRESGQIEADADIVLLLHREDYYERESPRAGEVDVIVAKNRQGPQTTVTLAFQGHYARMMSMARDDQVPPEASWSAASDFRGVA
jgi:replicative DNA helicase